MKIDQDYIDLFKNKWYADKEHPNVSLTAHRATRTYKVEGADENNPMTKVTDFILHRLASDYIYLPVLMSRTEFVDIETGKRFATQVYDQDTNTHLNIGTHISLTAVNKASIPDGLLMYGMAAFDGQRWVDAFRGEIDEVMEGKQTFFNYWPYYFSWRDIFIGDKDNGFNSFPYRTRSKVITTGVIKDFDGTSLTTTISEDFNHMLEHVLSGYDGGTYVVMDGNSTELNPIVGKLNLSFKSMSGSVGRPNYVLDEKKGLVPKVRDN